MNAPVPAPPTRSDFSPFHRFKCWITGVDPDLLATCPTRDHDSVNMIFLLQLGAWLWQWLMFSLAAHMMLASAGEVRPELVGIGFLLASIIALIDSFMIIRSSWYLHGLEELKRGGLVLPGTFVAKLKNGCFLAFRLALSAVLVQLVAYFVMMLLLGKEVSWHLGAAFHTRNAAVIQSAEARYDGETAVIREDRSKVSAALFRTDEDASVLRRGAASTSQDDDLRELRHRLNRLEDQKPKADAEVGRARAAARRSGDATSRWIRAAMARAATVARELATARARLREAESRQAAFTKQRNNLISTHLAEAATDRAAQLSRLAALDEKLRQRAADRERAIQTAIDRDPSVQPREDGLLARVQVLGELTENRRNLMLIILIDATFFAIELAAVLAKATTFIPATYATSLAETEYLRAFETSRKLAERINAIGPAPSTAAEVTDYDGTITEDASSPSRRDPSPPMSGSIEGLDASLQRAAQAANARSTRRGKDGTPSPDASGESQEDGPQRRPRGRPPGPRQLPSAPGERFDFGGNRSPDPSDGDSH